MDIHLGPVAFIWLVLRKALVKHYEVSGPVAERLKKGILKREVLSTCFKTFIVIRLFYQMVS